jgi:dihydrofolate synthase/folylpolyglutamate synthase
VDPLAYLFSLERFGMKFGLDNMAGLTAALGYPQRAFASIIVAGTNGKGSVTAMADAGLRAAGHRTARYTSPHLERLEERFVLDGEEVRTADLRSAAAVVRAAIERLLADGTFEAPPTFFECATAIAFVLFRDAGIRLAVLEVGLGGRLDATNIVTPVAAAITSIDFDHQAQLGGTLESIAFEKGGVIKAGIPVVCGPLPPEAARVIEGICADRGARLVPAAVAEVDRRLGARPLALAGAHQRVNAAVAIALLGELDRMGFAVPDAAIVEGLTTVRWPARLERFRRGAAEVLVDAAHNPAGARALAAHLASIGWRDAALVVGVMQDKDVDGVLAPLLPLCRLVVCTTPPTPRAMPADALAAAVRRLGGAAVDVAAIADAPAALAEACRSHPRVIVAGSIFLAGPLRGILGR